MLEGRARLTAPFIRFARDYQHAAPRSEPKLALALGAYAREHQVVAVPADGEVIDLGVPAVPAPRKHSGRRWPMTSLEAAPEVLRWQRGRRSRLAARPRCRHHKPNPDAAPSTMSATPPG